MTSETPTFISPTFGPKGVIPTDATAWWACRAINAHGQVDLLSDCQDAGGPAKEVLLRYLNGGVLQAIRNEVTRIWREERGYAGDFEIDSLGIVKAGHGRDYAGLRGHFRAAGGYYYIAVWAEPNPSIDLKSWSGASKGYPVPPAPGSTVTVSMNNIGRAMVLRHFEEAGFLGVVVLPLDPPEWYVKQNGRSALAGVFGVELAQVAPVTPLAMLHDSIAVDVVDAGGGYQGTYNTGAKAQTAVAEAVGLGLGPFTIKPAAAGKVCCDCGEAIAEHLGIFQDEEDFGAYRCASCEGPLRFPDEPSRSALAGVFGVELAPPVQLVVNHPVQGAMSEAAAKGVATLHDSIVCRFCGQPTTTDPSDQTPPADHCDHSGEEPLRFEDEPSPPTEEQNNAANMAGKYGLPIATVNLIRALWQTHGPLHAIKALREADAVCSLFQAHAAVKDICEGLEESQYSVWGATEVLIAQTRRIADRESTIRDMKRSEVYMVGFLADGRVLLLNRQYTGIALVDEAIGKVLIDPNPVGMQGPPAVVVTSRWSDYSLSHDACGVPAGTTFDAYWLAHPESSDGREAKRRLDRDHDLEGSMH